MLTRIATSLPLGSVDALFARGIAWISPKVGARACLADCSNVHQCGFCSCSPNDPCGPTRPRYCDNCGPGDFCYCSPPCGGPC